MDEGGLDYALNRAIDAFYNDKTWFRALQVSPCCDCKLNVIFVMFTGETLQWRTRA
jgi:hypothetical protein